MKNNYILFFVFLFSFKGDEVVELGGVSLRGKSAVFVENLMNTIQNEFEIIVRNQFVHSLLSTDNNNIQRRHSVDTSTSPIINNIVIKSKSKSIDSIERIDKIIEEDETSRTVRKIRFRLSN
jgi:hypothetical protein